MIATTATAEAAATQPIPIITPATAEVITAIETPPTVSTTAITATATTATDATTTKATTYCLLSIKF